MTETKFTDGKWAAQYDDNGFYHVWAVGCPSPYIVATGGEGEEDQANAHLIAAAPDLYAEGERTASIMETVAEALPDGESKTILLSAAHTQRAALAKARGA